MEREFYADERSRFHHYYKLNKKCKGKQMKQDLKNILYLCHADLRLQISLEKSKVAQLRRIGAPTPPVEITDSLAKFNRMFSDQKTAFVIMSFEKTEAHTAIFDAIKANLLEFGIVGMRADEYEFHENMYDNIRTYMYGCTFGVAVYERISSQEHNPNIAYEIGYMKGLKKSVCLLKDKTIKVLHADLLGKLYKEFDTRDVGRTVDLALKSWIGTRVNMPGRPAVHWIRCKPADA